MSITGWEDIIQLSVGRSKGSYLFYIIEERDVYFSAVNPCVNVIHIKEYFLITFGPDLMCNKILKIINMCVLGLNF